MKKDTIIAILASWFVFLIWEIFIFLHLENIKIDSLRWDLIVVLPGLIGLSGYYFFKIKKEHTKDT